MFSGSAALNSQVLADRAWKRKRAKGVIFQLPQIQLLQLCLLTDLRCKKASRDTPKAELSTCPRVPASRSSVGEDCPAHCRQGSIICDFHPLDASKTLLIVFSRHYQMSLLGQDHLIWGPGLSRNLLSLLLGRSGLIRLKPNEHSMKELTQTCTHLPNSKMKGAEGHFFFFLNHSGMAEQRQTCPLQSISQAVNQGRGKKS